MNTNEQIFDSILDKLASQNEGVVEGKMMSSRGIKYGKKVFAFFDNESMGFRMGPSFDPDEYGLMHVRPLSPFKTKPPLKGWYIVDEPESKFWEDLAGRALAFTQTLK